jgi:hypothetical protein
VLLADLTAADILELQTEVFTSLFSMMYFVWRQSLSEYIVTLSHFVSKLLT